MNKDTLERLRETVLVPHGDPQLVLYTKLVVGLLWLVHLPLGFLYGAPLPFYLLLGGMMLLDGVNLFLSRRSASRAREPGCSAGVSGRQRPAFPEGLCGVFQLVFPADILLFLHLRAGPRGRHFYQPSELSLGDGLPARRAHPRPPPPSTARASCAVSRSFTSASSGWPTSSCSPSSATGWTRPNAIFYCSSASTRRRANSRRCR